MEQPLAAVQLAQSRLAEGLELLAAAQRAKHLQPLNRRGVSTEERSPATATEIGRGVRAALVLVGAPGAEPTQLGLLIVRVGVRIGVRIGVRVRVKVRGMIGVRVRVSSRGQG
eukprot:scaffold129494_cov48-Phaeocystis_antarctica.AAC.1